MHLCPMFNIMFSVFVIFLTIIVRLARVSRTGCIDAGKT